MLTMLKLKLTNRVRISVQADDVKILPRNACGPFSLYTVQLLDKMYQNICHDC